ncbi:MAG: hypothetical protein ABL879_14560 [Devosia sp.]
MTRMSLTRLVLATGAASLLLAGCAWDYLANTDRVSYSAGDAVNANLEAQTANPSGANQYNTKGLGKDGNVLPPAADTP